MHHPKPLTPTLFAGAGRLLFAGSARDLAATLNRLKAETQGVIPQWKDQEAQDVDASAPHYAPGLSRAAKADATHEVQA